MNTILFQFCIPNELQSAKVQVYTYLQRVSNFKSHKGMNVPFHSIKPLLLHFKIVAFHQYEVFAYWKAFLRYWMFIYPFMLAQWKKFFFFCQEDSRNSVQHIAGGSTTLLPYSSAWIYGRYKENLQQESFCTSTLLRSINPRLAFSPPFCYSALPFH